MVITGTERVMSIVPEQQDAVAALMRRGINEADRLLPVFAAPSDLKLIEDIRVLYQWDWMS